MKVDWSSLPVPQDDGEADHLLNSNIPPVSLPSTDGKSVTLSTLPGNTVLYIYPRTGQPGKSNPEGWDMIPGINPRAQTSPANPEAHADVLRNPAPSGTILKSSVISG